MKTCSVPVCSRLTRPRCAYCDPCFRQIRGVERSERYSRTQGKRPACATEPRYSVERTMVPAWAEDKKLLPMRPPRRVTEDE